jgi:hypothetical protein
MRVLKIMGLGAALALAGTSAFAFQEQQGGKAPVAAPAQAPAVQDPAKDYNLSDSGIAKPSQGTEVRIPGLGRLGVLPKMDFGLELLYGAADPKQPDLPQDAPADGDMTIRGTVKHRF